MSVFHGNVKHEMGSAVPAYAVKEPLLRLHIGHRARLEGRQFPFLNRGLHTYRDTALPTPQAARDSRPWTGAGLHELSRNSGRGSGTLAARTSGIQKKERKSAVQGSVQKGRHHRRRRI